LTKLLRGGKESKMKGVHVGVREDQEKGTEEELDREKTTTTKVVVEERCNLRSRGGREVS